jgi:hypothetical protein
MKLINLEKLSAIPSNTERISHQLFQGTIFFFSCPILEQIIEIVERELKKCWGNHFATNEFIWNPKKHYQELQIIRRKIIQNPLIPKLFISLFSKSTVQKGFYLDFPRLRAITTYGHHISEAKPAYYFHRDTWYGNSPSQWNFWIPLQNITPLNSFGFATEFFNQPIPNNSHLFCLYDWNQSGGFQNLKKSKKTKTPQMYPRNLEKIPKDRISSFSLNKGEAMIFSAQHLHGTLPNRSHKTRFSLDIRVVMSEDLRLGKCAPQIDNFSQGLNLNDMMKINCKTV